jgi:hypothetical protein
MKLDIRLTLKAFGLLWLLALLCGPELAAWFGLHLDPSGHSHLHAHGHPFIDARMWFGIPNTLDVLSNLPFLIFGLWGLCKLGRRAQMGANRLAATAFFLGLIFTAIGSSVYHWHPDSWGLAIDRTGMAVAFAGLLGLAWYERTALTSTQTLTGVCFILAVISAWLPHFVANIWPWVLLQFGGILIVLICALLPKQDRGMGIAFMPVLVLYALAKAFEAADANVFAWTQGMISGHSIKHILASFAALPVIFAMQSHQKEAPTASAKLRVEEAL